VRREHPTSPPPFFNSNAAADSSTAVGTAAHKRPRRNHNKEIDNINDKLDVLMERDEDLQRTITAWRAEASVARSLLASFQAVRSAHETQSEYAKGKDVRDCLRSSFLIRIRKCPPAPRRVGDAESTSVAISIDCSREAFVEFLRVAGLQQENDLMPSSRSTCVARAGSSVDFFAALGVPDELTGACLSRTFVRKNKSCVRRSIVHHIVDDDGHDWFVLRREPCGLRVTVVTREVEEFEVSVQSFTEAYLVRTMGVDEVPPLGPSPFSFVWKAHHLSGAVDGAPTNRIGRVTVLIPAYVHEGHGTELSRWL